MAEDEALEGVEEGVEQGIVESAKADAISGGESLPMDNTGGKPGEPGGEAEEGTGGKPGDDTEPGDDLATKKDKLTKNPKFEENVAKAKGNLAKITDNPLNAAFVAFVGIEAILALTVQDEDECIQNCKDRKNSTLDCSDQTPTVVAANCPSGSDDCGTYCKDACSQDNRMNRALCLMKKNPASVLTSALGKIVTSPFNIWDTFKYEIIGFFLLLGGFFLYKYTSSWATSAGSALNLAGTKRGKRITTDLDKVVKPLRKKS